MVVNAMRCLKYIGEDCQCFDMINQLLFDYAPPTGMNITIDCNNCDFIFEDQMEEQNSSMNIFQFDECTQSERLTAQTKIDYIPKHNYEDTITRIEILEVIKLAYQADSYNLIHKHIKALSAKEFFDRQQNFTFVKIENSTIKTASADLLDGFQQALAVSLRNNSIIELSQNLLWNLTTLQGLDLSLNEISSIPKKFFKNSTLKYLWMSHNKIANILE